MALTSANFSRVVNLVVGIFSCKSRKKKTKFCFITFFVLPYYGDFLNFQNLFKGTLRQILNKQNKSSLPLKKNSNFTGE